MKNNTFEKLKKMYIQAIKKSIQFKKTYHINNLHKIVLITPLETYKDII